MINTSRLTLRPWTEADVPEFVRVTNTPEVMEYLGGAQAPDAFHGGFLRARASQAENGFCFWIAERLNDRALLGFYGLKRANVGPITGEIEIGWRLRADALWGTGLCAGGGGRESRLGLAKSRLPARRRHHCGRKCEKLRLMERLGMQRMHDLDFDHPDLPPDSPLRPHVCYAAARTGS
jgi:hypothetical protein